MSRLILPVILSIALTVPPGVTAQVSQDSLEASQEPLFTAEDALFAGGVIFATLAIAPLDKRFADYLQGAPQTNRFFRRVSWIVENIAQPGAYLIGGALYGIGKRSEERRVGKECRSRWWPYR